jgi:hypothetical protein
MELILVAVNARLATMFEADPKLIAQIFSEIGNTSGDVDEEIQNVGSDYFLEDFRGILSKVEPQDFPWLHKAINGSGRTVDYDFGYGQGFLLTPSEVAEVASGLVAEGWLRDVPNIYVQRQVARYYKQASENGYYIIGGVG